MWRSLILSFLILIAAPLTAEDNEEFRFGDDIFTAGKWVSHSTGSVDDLFAFADRVVASAPVSGSAHVIGRNVTISGGVGENLYAAGRNVTLSSAVAGDAVFLGETVTINGDIGGDLRVAGSNVELTGTVGDAALVGGEMVMINAEITGDLGLAADSVEFGPDAKVIGQVHIYSDNPESIEVPSRVASGDQIVLHQSEEWEGVTTDHQVGHAPSAWQKFRSMVSKILVVTVLTTIFAAIAPNFIMGLRERALDAPLRTGVIGFIGLSATIGSLVLFAMTGFGILLVPVSIIAALLLSLAGYLIGTYVLGVAVTGIIGREMPDSLGDRALAAFLGAVVVAILTLIPFVGWLFALALAWVGVGALITRWFSPAFYVTDA